MTTPEYSHLWNLDPDYTHLNHASFGACPKAILEDFFEWRLRIENNPMKFFKRDLGPLLEEVRLYLQDFFKAVGYQFHFVANATTGINTILKNIPLQANDEIICNQYVYPACMNALRYYTGRHNAKVRMVHTPYPFGSYDQLVQAYKEGINENTRYVFLEHVSSPLGIIYPLADLIKEFKSHGIKIIVDGAHAPGMLAVDLDELCVDFYVGNFHKWLCAPRSQAFLAIHSQLNPKSDLETFRGMIIGHGRENPSRSLLSQDSDWPGTFDPSPLLCLPKVINFLETTAGTWNHLWQRNHSLVKEAYEWICDELKVKSMIDSECYGSMISIPLASTRERANGIDPLQQVLYEKENIEVPVFTWQASGERWIRISAYLYNTLADYKKLVSALSKHGLFTN